MDANQLHGLWFHSHEEDAGGRKVFRGRSYDFPPARAPRESFTLEPDGTATFGAPGPDDAPVTGRGTWRLRGGVLTLSGPGRRETYQVESAEGEKLVLRPRSTGETTNGEED